MTLNSVSKLGLVVLVTFFMTVIATSGFAQQMQQGQQEQGRIGDQPGEGESRGQGRAGGQSGGMGFMERFDADKDGKVTKEELGDRENFLTRLDKNEDGVITEDEAPTFSRQGGEGRPQMQGGEQEQGRIGDQPGAE